MRIREHGTPSEIAAICNTRLYWLKHAEEWSHLFHVATYWLNFNTSSIETFAKLRSMSAPCRLCALPESWARQLAFTCNVKIVDKLLEDALAVLGT